MNKQMPVNNEPLDARSAFAADIFEGLSKHQKSIPCQYFYDEIGSGLFEQITDLDEYYPTRTEISILNACVAVIAAQTAHATALIEFGSGSSLKTDILFAACPAIKHYVPIDVSLTMLASAKERLATRFPRLVVEPVMGDFTAKVTLPADVGALPKLGFFPGSTIGNFSHDTAVGLFSHFRDLLGRGARLIVGADLR